MALGTEERHQLIIRRLELQNGWSAQRLHDLVVSDRKIKYQWVTAPTGKPHIGYFIPLIKLADFIRSGGEVVVEFLDTYAFLVNYRYPWSQVQHRTGYYRSLITAALWSIGAPMAKITTAQMSRYQKDPRFMVDFWKLCALCSQQDAKDTGVEVGSATMLSPLLTPLMQELGEEYLDIDVQLGGTDQRGIYNLGEQFLPELGYRKRVHILNELLPSLTGGKMSSSHPAHTKIMFLDDSDAVRAKLDGAACPAGTAQGNGVLPIVEHILIPISELQMLNIRDSFGVSNGSNGTNGTHDKKANGAKLNGDTDKTTGVNGCHVAYEKGPFARHGAPDGTLFSVASTDAQHCHYVTYQELESDYVAGVIGPGGLKEAVAAALDHVLEPIRRLYAGDAEWKQADWDGYPEDRPVAAPPL